MINSRAGQPALFVIIGLLLFIPNTVNAATGDRFTVNDIEYLIIQENSSYNLVDVSQYHGNETNIIILETVENEGKVFDVISIGYTYSLGFLEDTGKTNNSEYQTKVLLSIDKATF